VSANVQGIGHLIGTVGLISMATEACLDLDEGNFNRNMPGMLVGLLFQSLNLLRKADSFAVR
jgi:hypothetical protein